MPTKTTKTKPKTTAKRKPAEMKAAPKRQTARDAFATRASMAINESVNEEQVRAIVSEMLYEALSQFAARLVATGTRGRKPVNQFDTRSNGAGDH